jgi:glutamate:GABA antiporter
MTAQTDSRELVSERVAGGILPRVLTTFDMVAIFVAIVLFITNSAAIQPAGPAAYGWWIIGFVVFLIPCAIATGQLGVMFPGEGSIYLWTHKAFGRFWGFFAGFCAWWPGVLVMVATGTLVISFLGYAFPAVAALSVVFALYGLAILAMFASGIVFLARGHHSAVNPWNFSQWAAGNSHGLNFTNWTFFGLVVLALLGVEVPLNMGVEIRDQRAVTRYLIWGSLVVMVAYVLATWGVMVTVHGARNGVITNVAQAVAVGLGSVVGKITAAVLALFFLFITVVYNYSFARLIFVSGLDRRLPAAMSHVNSARVPDIAVWVQTVIAAVFTLIAFVLVPTISTGRSVNSETRVYDVLQAAVTVIWCISIAVLFADILIILRRYRTQFQARRLAHPAVFWACSVIGGLGSIVGIIATLSGSWNSQLISNDAGTLKIFGAVISYGTWFWWVGGITVASLAIAVFVYLLGRRATSESQPLATARMSPRHRRQVG